MKIIEIPKWGGYLRETWLKHFASQLSKEEQKDIYLDNFLWHLCSWEKTKYLEKEEATEAFNNLKKEKCTLFYQLVDEAYLIENAHNLTATNLYDIAPDDEGTDLYVLDWEGKWTFMITHEEDLRPYFIQKHT